MSTSKTVALSLAAILLSAVSVQAAPHHKPAHHTMRHPAHAMRHGGAMHGKPAAPSADRSADALNAQSLTRAQSPQ